MSLSLKIVSIETLVVSKLYFEFNMSTFGLGLAHLKEMQLSCCRVTDAGIAYLKGKHSGEQFRF